MELTHNWGTEKDANFKGYHSGNEEPQGFGHIGLDVPNVAAACKRFSDLGAETLSPAGHDQALCFPPDPTPAHESAQLASSRPLVKASR